jgi:hypothetical protein
MLLCIFFGTIGAFLISRRNDCQSMHMDTDFYLWVNDQKKCPHEEDHLVCWVTENSKNKDVFLDTGHE